MQKQKSVFYSKIFNDVISISNDVRVIAIINLFGELIYQNSHNCANIPPKILEEQIQKLAFSTSILSFENIKFMIVDRNEMKMLIINSNEDSIIIGMEKNSACRGIPELLDYFSSRNMI